MTANVIPIRYRNNDDNWLQGHAVITLGSPQAEERRRHSRFLLTSSITLVLKQGTCSQPVDAVTENISLGGILVRVPCPLPEHAKVGFVVDVRGTFQQKGIRLKGTGRVVRLEPGRAPGEFLAAIKCSRPMYQGR